MPHPARILEERLIGFAVEVSRLATRLPRSPLGIHLSRQLLRSGTAAAPNYAEAQSAESRQDFIHKMRICLKELREAQVWLRMLVKLRARPAVELDAISRECNELVSIFTKSVLTAAKRARTPGL